MSSPHVRHALAVRLLAITCIGCGGFRASAGPTVTTEGAVGAQATVTVVLGIGDAAIGGGGSVRVDRDAVTATQLAIVDYTLSDGISNGADTVLPTRLTRFTVRFGRAHFVRDDEEAATLGFGVAHHKVLRATETCMLFGNVDRLGVGGAATVDLERRPTGNVGVIGVGVTLQYDFWPSIRKCD